MIETIEQLMERLKEMQADHNPNGWPAVRMREITALCEHAERLAYELKRIIRVHIVDDDDWEPDSKTEKIYNRIMSSEK